MKVILETTRAH